MEDIPWDTKGNDLVPTEGIACLLVLSLSLTSTHKPPPYHKEWNLLSYMPNYII